MEELELQPEEHALDEINSRRFDHRRINVAILTETTQSKNCAPWNAPIIDRMHVKGVRTRRAWMGHPSRSKFHSPKLPR